MDLLNSVQKFDYVMLDCSECFTAVLTDSGSELPQVLRRGSQQTLPSVPSRASLFVWQNMPSSRMKLDTDSLIKYVTVRHRMIEVSHNQFDLFMTRFSYL